MLRVRLLGVKVLNNLSARLLLVEQGLSNVLCDDELLSCLCTLSLPAPDLQPGMHLSATYLHSPSV